MNLFSIAKYVIYGIGFNICVLCFIQENNELVMHLSYESIKIYSRLQLYFKKKYDNVKNKLILWNIIKKNIMKYQIIKNNNICDVFLKDLHNYNYNLNYIDYIVYTDQTTSISNKIFYFNIPNDFYYTKCNYNFISVNLNISNNYYNIKLHSENENYFITNNKINKYTLSYILKCQFNKIIENEPYTLSFIDQNINSEEITEKDEIIFNLDNYTIKPLISDKFNFNNNYDFDSEKNKKSDSESESELVFESESNSEYGIDLIPELLLDFENTHSINDNVEPEELDIVCFDKPLDINKNEKSICIIC